MNDYCYYSSGFPLNYNCSIRAQPQSNYEGTVILLDKGFGVYTGLELDEQRLRTSGFRPRPRSNDPCLEVHG